MADRGDEALGDELGQEEFDRLDRIMADEPLTEFDRVRAYFQGEAWEDIDVPNN